MWPNVIAKPRSPSVAYRDPLHLIRLQIKLLAGQGTSTKVALLFMPLLIKVSIVHSVNNRNN
mgnify:CR=1 FL=1